MSGILLKKSPIVTIVGTGIGAALFFVVGRFIAIPSIIPNTNISIQYAVLALFALLYGPIAGMLVGLVGHYLIDVSSFGAWWSWILSSALLGLILGLLMYKIKVDKASFKGKSIVWFISSIVIANAITWIFIAPTLDIAIYAEPADKVFFQGLMAFVSNSITAAVVGTIIAVAYANTVTPKGSLSEYTDEQ